MGSLKRAIMSGDTRAEPKKKRQKDQKGEKVPKNFQKQVEPSKKTSDKTALFQLHKKSRSNAGKPNTVQENNKLITGKIKLFQANKKNSTGKPDKKLEHSNKYISKPKVFQANEKRTAGKQDIFKDLKEKPDWKDLKKKAKEIRKKRKEHKRCSQYDSTVKAKQLWEKLRRDDCPSEKALELTTELFVLLQNQLQKMVFVHDMARIVQWLLKLGAPNIRASITEELKPILGTMVQTKYSSFCVKRMLKYGSPESRNTVMQAFRGNVVKFMSHATASPVVEYAYDQWATLNQRNELKQEFYGDVYKLSQGEKIQNIADAVSRSPDMKKCILADTKKNILHIINKGLFKSGLVLSVLLDFLNHCTSEDKDELLTLIRPYIVELLHIKEGARVGMICCWYSTPKERKMLMKSVKGHVKNVAVSEHGHLFLLALFDSVDDTVTLKKAVISELIPLVTEIAANENGRKVILYLVAHRDPLYFHPSLMNVLTAGDASETIKKSMDIREAELRESVIKPLLNSVASHTSTWFSSGSVAMVTLAILKAGKGEQQEQAFKAIAKYICSSQSKITENEVSYPIMEHTGTHMVLKKIIQHDKEVVKNGDVTFSSTLVQEFSEPTILRGIACNRFCFLLTAVMESSIPVAEEMLREKMNGNIVNQLKKQKSVGAKILLAKLTQAES